MSPIAECEHREKLLGQRICRHHLSGHTSYSTAQLCRFFRFIFSNLFRNFQKEENSLASVSVQRSVERTVRCRFTVDGGAADFMDGWPVRRCWSGCASSFRGFAKSDSQTDVFVQGFEVLFGKRMHVKIAGDIIFLFPSEASTAKPKAASLRVLPARFIHRSPSHFS